MRLFSASEFGATSNSTNCLFGDAIGSKRKDDLDGLGFGSSTPSHFATLSIVVPCATHKKWAAENRGARGHFYELSNSVHPVEDDRTSGSERAER
jgi:hypothetical protein